MPKTLIRNQERTLELSEKKAFLQGERWLKANNNNSVTGKIYTFSCAEREHDCAVHTAGNRLQMKANLVSLCNWELQLDHRSPWNKDGGRRAREGKRRRAREGVRCERKEEEGGGGCRKKTKKTGHPGPPGQTIAARWERGSRALPVPKAHSCWSGARRLKQPQTSSGVHFQRQLSLGCYGNGRNRERETPFVFQFHAEMMSASIPRSFWQINKTK